MGDVAAVARRRGSNRREDGGEKGKKVGAEVVEGVGSCAHVA